MSERVYIERGTGYWYVRRDYQNGDRDTYGPFKWWVRAVLCLLFEVVP